jgi:predicted transcriptional regulator of viral defense system
LPCNIAAASFAAALLSPLRVKGIAGGGCFGFQQSYSEASGSVSSRDPLAALQRAPNAAVCLFSALSYHGITTQIPSSLHLAVPRGSYHGIKLSIPVTAYRFHQKNFNDGLETHRQRRLRTSLWRHIRRDGRIDSKIWEHETNG